MEELAASLVIFGRGNLLKTLFDRRVSVKGKSIGLKSVRLYGAVDNVYVWTNYSGFDPDVSVGRNQLTPGLDVDSYPRSRTFRIGLNANF